MKAILTYLRACIYIICILLLSASCTHRAEEQMMDEAESLMAEFPDSAYCILQGIDLGQLPEGSEIEARYALLCTQAQYKCYADIPNDSLISVAVDYYEAYGDPQDKFYAYLYQGIVRYLTGKLSMSSLSLIKSLLNSEDVTDHYSKGQLMMYLAAINERMQCKDEELYARKAANEYQSGGLDSYYLNAMIKVAEAKMRNGDFESDHVLLDSLSTLAREQNDSSALCSVLRIKAHCAICENSLSLADEIYNELLNDYDLEPNTQEYGNLAVIASVKRPEIFRDYLKAAEELRATRDDTINYWVKAMWCYWYVSDLEAVVACQDTVLRYAGDLLSEYQTHTTIEAQREYSDWQLKHAEDRLRQTYVALSSIAVIVILCVLFFYELYKRKETIIQSQSDRIKLLQIEQQVMAEERQNALHNIQKNAFIREIMLDSNRMEGLTVKDWRQIEHLFSEYLPHFEPSLKKIVSISEYELKICMLIKLGFEPGRIAVLTDHSISSIAMVRSRLYKKAFRKSGKTSEWDSFINSI